MDDVTSALTSQCQRRITVLEAQIKTLMEITKDLARRVGPEAKPPVTMEEFQKLQDKVSEMRDHQDGMNDTLHGVTERVGASAANRSAAKKRPMTDADAETVLRGDHADLKHKEAGEVLGLSYAQVYSCRCEYTFKEVHLKLRKEGWKNPWAK